MLTLMTDQAPEDPAPSLTWRCRLGWHAWDAPRIVMLSGAAKDTTVLTVRRCARCRGEMVVKRHV